MGSGWEIRRQKQAKSRGTARRESCPEHQPGYLKTMPHPPSPRTAAWRSGLALLLVVAARAAEADPSLVVNLAVENLEQRRQYAWEFRDLAGEVENKTVWKATTPNFSADQQQPVAKKIRITTLSPTVHGEYCPDGWSLAASGFVKGPKVAVVINPSGVRVIQFDHGEWLPFAKFRRDYERIAADPQRLALSKAQMRYSAAWAAFTSPRPHILLPKLLRAAERFRFEQDEIVAEVNADTARLLLGGDGPARKLAPDRFKGNVRLRVREGVLQECRIQLDYDVDLTKAETPSTENIDVLILLTAPSVVPPVVPEQARALLSSG
jgi:hypothetical protein